MKNEGHLGRCHLKGRDGDAANAILTAVGYNFRLLLAWLRALWRLIVVPIRSAFAIQSTPRSVLVTGNYVVSQFLGNDKMSLLIRVHKVMRVDS